MLRSHWKTPLVSGAWVVLVLLPMHWISQPWENRAEATLGAETPALNQESFQHSLSLSIIPGLAGGLQNLAADFVWLRMNHSWTQREIAETQNFIQLAITLDPRFFYFWRNGARILAYDIPVWRIRRARETRGELPPVREREIREEQAQQAIQLLLEARVYHPDSPEVWIEIGQIQNNILKDPLAASRSFKEATEKPGAPYFAGRLHAELLRRAGYPEKAYRYYREIHPTLPPELPEAAAEVVLMRIRDLEEELEVEPEARYLP